MNESARQKLLEIFAKHGSSVIENPRRLEGLLRDYCGAFRREISVLVAAVEEHAVSDLLAAPESLPRKFLLSRLVQRLCDNLGLSEASARWAIESWSLALGVISEAEITPDKSVVEIKESILQGKLSFGRSGAAQTAPVTATAATQPQTASNSLIVASDGTGHFTSLTEALRSAPPDSLITIREGLYVESIVLEKAVKIVGVGSPQRIIVRGVNAGALVIRAAKVQVTGITLQARATHGGQAFFAVEISRGEIILEDCDVTSDSLSGIAVFGADADPLIKNCRIYGCTDSGIYIFDNARGRFSDCTIYRNVNVNVAITGGAQPTLKNCRIFEGGNGGVVVWGKGSAGLIEDCRIYAHRLANVGVREFANPLFRNCEIYDGYDTGIYIHQNGYGTFEGCQIYRNAKAEVGITENADSVLRRCIIRNGENSGIIVQNRGRVAVESCDIYDNADAGVALFGESEAIVRSCRIQSNGTVGVRVLDASAATVEDCDLRGNLIATWETEQGISIDRRNNRED